MSTGGGGTKNVAVFPVSRHGQRNGSRASVPSVPGASPLSLIRRSGQKRDMILYRLLLSLVAPAILARLLWQRLRGRAAPGDLTERLGASGHGPADLWLHGASNGELASVRGLAAALVAARPGLRLRVTANTATARAMVAGWGLPGVSAALAPLDLRWVLARFLSRTRPGLLVVVENEFWPNRLTACAARGIPVAVVGARMSGSSARGWRRFPGLTRRVLAAIRFLSAQDPGSEARFRALGLPGDRIGPVVNLKAFVAPLVPEDEQARLAPLFPRDRTLLAASTHECEEEAVIAAFARLHAADASWRLILAPRHPRRGDAVAALIGAAGLGHARRSRGAVPGPDMPVLLADTMGEMALWQALAGVAFIGGSLVDRGGHAPFEAAAQDVVILHGPHVANSAAAYAALDAAGGALRVTDADTLAAAVAGLDAAARDRMTQAARAALARLAAPAIGGETAEAALAARLLDLLAAHPPRRA